MFHPTDVPSLEPPFISHEWPFRRGTTRSLGDPSPWLLTTYKSRDDPPSKPPIVYISGQIIATSHDLTPIGS